MNQKHNRYTKNKAKQAQPHVVILEGKRESSVSDGIHRRTLRYLGKNNYFECGPPTEWSHESTMERAEVDQR